MTGPRAVLIGPPGSGKSTVGKALARVWNLPLRDTDADVEEAAGAAVADIFFDRGEDEFRVLEAAAVARAMAEHEGVLSLGGGAILHQATQNLLVDYGRDGGAVVFLDVSLSAAAPRVGLNAARPLLAGNPRKRWQELMNDRRPIYEGLATCTVSTDAISPAAVAARIDELVGGRS